MNDATAPSWAPLRSWRVWGLALAIWVGVQLLILGTQLASARFHGSPPELAPERALVASALVYFLPFVVATVWLLQIAPRLASRDGAAYWWGLVRTAVALALAHSTLWTAWRAWCLGDGSLFGLMSTRFGDGAWVWPAIAGVGSLSFHYAAILGVVLAIDHERVAQARRRELLAARLRALRAQLQPHFLFNTLHAIGVTAARDGPTAARMTTLLGDLLRHSLRERDGDLVSLAEERELLQPYLALQELRFADRLRIEVDLEPELLGAAVPDLVLQPLVENALRHGIEQRPGPGSVRVRARREGETLVVEVEDDGVGPGASDARDGTGTGLASTRARLQALYGERASLTLRENGLGGARATLRLPYRELNDAA